MTETPGTVCIIKHDKSIIEMMEFNLTILTVVTYLFLGALAGIIGGLFGLGGGIIIVPALFFLFTSQGMPTEIIMHVAVATSLATIIFTSISSTWAHHRHGAVQWPTVFLLAPGIVTGCILGALLADMLKSDYLKSAFGIFEILVALQVGFNIKPEGKRVLPGKEGMLVAGGGIGTVSTILGIGGGTLTVPYLLWCNVNIRNAVATSSACGLPIAIAGTMGLIITGWSNSYLPYGSTGYVYWPAATGILVASVLTAPLGAKLAHALPVVILKRIFAVILCTIGIRMLV